MQASRICRIAAIVKKNTSVPAKTGEDYSWLTAEDVAGMDYQTKRHAVSVLGLQTESKSGADLTAALMAHINKEA